MARRPVRFPPQHELVAADARRPKLIGQPEGSRREREPAVEGGHPSLFQSLQATLLWLLEVLSDVLLLFGAAANWLVPLVWVLWGLGLAAMLLLAGGAHFLMSRLPSLKPHGT